MSSEDIRAQAQAQEQEPVVIRDNRKIDRDGKVAGAGDTTPASGADPAATAEPAVEAGVPMVEAALLDERTADLQRVQAEYANYRKRADRDRLAAGDIATGRVLAELLPVIDDLDRVKAHDDLTGPIKSIADKLDSVFAKLGLTAFGVVGDPFDPSVHEAVLHDESDMVAVPTCTTIMVQGYTFGDRLLRPAMVGVSEPTQEIAAAEPAATEPEGATTSEREFNETSARPPEEVFNEGNQRNEPQGE